MILILDVSSTAIGYALFHADGRFRSAGVVRPDRPHRDACRRACCMARHVQQLIDEHADQIESVVIEEAPRFKTQGDIAAQNRAYGIVVATLIGSRLEYAEVHPAKWTRNTKKETRAAAIAARFGVQVGSDKGFDACDAIALGEWWFSHGKSHFAAQEMSHRAPRKTPRRRAEKVQPC